MNQLSWASEFNKWVNCWSHPIDYKWFWRPFQFVCFATCRFPAAFKNFDWGKWVLVTKYRACFYCGTVIRTVICHGIRKLCRKLRRSWKCVVERHLWSAEVTNESRGTTPSVVSTANSYSFYDSQFSVMRHLWSDEVTNDTIYCQYRQLGIYIYFFLWFICNLSSD